VAVRLRLKKTGRTNRMSFRIVAMEMRVKRDGKTLEDLGSYDPQAADDAKVQVKLDRVEFWLARGASPSNPVAAILRKAKVPVDAIRKNASKAQAIT
jgi:small subunit ribosomal protein S16